MVFGRLTGNPEVISASIGLVPTDALVVRRSNTGSCSSQWHWSRFRCVRSDKPFFTTLCREARLYEWGQKWREPCRFQRHLGTNFLQRIDSRGGATALSISFCCSTSSQFSSGACLPMVCRLLFAGSWCDRIFFGPVSSSLGTCSLPRQDAPTATSKRCWLILTGPLIIGNFPG